ncbi:MAG: ATPase, T2SS/T4P/T4SS family [Candidatus Omnitrophica bacterium]|nr:ATPase, T2SS/T4P/T4SS family [Candidatus Omnitrophota bacterium]
MIGESLVEKGIISRRQMDEALSEQKSSGEFLGSILAGKKFASEHLIAKALSEELGLAFMDLSKYSIEAAAIKLVPEAVCRKYTLVPVYEAGGNLTVAMADPTDAAVKDELNGLTKLKIRPVFSPVSEIKARIDKEYAGASKSRYAAQAPVQAAAPGKEVEELIEVASLAPVIQVVDTLITKAVEVGASDIHLEPDKGHFYCRYRIDGILREIPELPKKYEAAIISRIKIMSSMDIAEKRLPQDGRIQTTVANKSVDLRVSTFPTLSGENVVLRILDKSRAFLELDGLGFAPENLKIMEKAIKRPFGMILVTGPTGSGKTTTLYAALNKVNNLDKNIMTLEDPVEYEIPRIRQSQVNVKAGLTFAAGLRSMVRQDPDIIMIGEIRDKETADIAIHAALTGHLVFSTLHTNDSASAATRLIDIGVEPFLVGTSVIAIIAQRLVRTLCPNCKKPYTPGREELDLLGAVPADEKAVFYREAGCRRCFDTGYSGRTGIFEMLTLDDKMKELISRKVSSTQIHEAAVRGGMKTLRDDGTLKVKAGITTVSEVLRVTKEA